MKNTLLFICSTNILVRLLTVNMKNCLIPKNPKMCDPILVTLLKMRPHYSQSSRENATPPSGISPLASYMEVHPPTPRPWVLPFKWNLFDRSLTWSLYSLDFTTKNLIFLRIFLWNFSFKIVSRYTTAYNSRFWPEHLPPVKDNKQIKL